MCTNPSRYGGVLFGHAADLDNDQINWTEKNIDALVRTERYSFIYGKDSEQWPVKPSRISCGQDGSAWLLDDEFGLWKA